MRFNTGTLTPAQQPHQELSFLSPLKLDEHPCAGAHQMIRCLAEVLQILCGRLCDGCIKASSKLRDSPLDAVEQRVIEDVLVPAATSGGPVSVRRHGAWSLVATSR